MGNFEILENFEIAFLPISISNSIIEDSPKRNLNQVTEDVHETVFIRILLLEVVFYSHYISIIFFS